MKMEAYWILQNLATGDHSDIKIILGDDSQLARGEILQKISTDLKIIMHGFTDLKLLKMCLQVLLNLALTPNNEFKIAGHILVKTPIAEVIHNLLASQDQIDLNLLEFAIELAATLIKAKKHLTEDKALLFIPPLKIAI